MPIGGADPVGATAYLDFVDEPVNAARRYRVLPFVWEPGPVDEILRHDAPSVLGDPRRNPPPDVRARLPRFRALTDDERSRFEQLFAAAVRADR